MHSQYETVARRYATAVFSLATEAGVSTGVGADLHAAADALHGDYEARRFFLSPVVDRGEKERILARVFDGKLGDLALHTLLLLVRKRREALLAPLVQAYDELMLAASGRETLEIVSARDLGPGEVDDLVGRLSKKYGKRFQLTRRVDPALLGGMRITMGDRLIDGSLAGRIDDLARSLAGAAAISEPAAPLPV